MRRRLRTRQIAFIARSTVTIIASALTKRAIRPTVPSRLARDENWVIAPITGLAIASGTSACRKYLSSDSCTAANIGNAENSASITVISGTSEMIVVKVRLPAVRARRSSRKRRTRVSTVASHGHCSTAASQRRAAGTPVTGRAIDALLAS